MSLTVSNHTLEKLEQLLKALHYKVRYEKGHFKTAACVLESSRIIVVNKFSNLEGKIMALAALAQTLETEEGLLDDKQKAFLHLLKQTKLEF